METDGSSHAPGKSLLLAWAILCVTVFMVLPGKTSYVQWSNLALWRLLGAKLDRLQPARDLIGLLGSGIGLFLFCLACTALGTYLWAKIIRSWPHPASPLTELVWLATKFIVGHGIYSLLFLGLAGTYGLTPALVLCLLAAGSLLGVRHLQGELQEGTLTVVSNVREILANGWQRTVLILATGTVCLGLFNTIARISYDSSAIYFSNAKLTALNQRIGFFVDDNFVVSAFHTSIQYTALMEVFGDQAARLFSWFFGIIFIVFVLGLGERMGTSRKGKIILLVLLVTSTSFLDLMGDGKVDLQSSAPALAAVYWIVFASQEKAVKKELHWLIGFLIGLAIIARPFNAFLVSFFVGLFYLQRMVLKRGFQPLYPRPFLNSILYICAGAIGLGIFHLFANWMIYGNSLAFLASISKINASAGPWDYDPDQILAIRLLYPFVATFFNSPQTLGNISPLLVAFLPALLIPDIRDRIKLSDQLSALVLTTLITLMLWIALFFTVHEIRYVLFLWAILYIPTAEVIAAILEHEDSRLKTATRALIVILLSFMLLRAIFIPLDTYSPVDENGNPQCFCDSLNSINEAAAPGDRVLTLSAHRYYLRTDLFACSTQHEEYRSLRDASQIGTEAFWLEVNRQGYRYIAFEEEYTNRHLQMGIIPHPENAPNWINLRPLYSAPGETHIAYRLDYMDPPTNAQAICRKNDSGIWEVQYAK